MSEQTKNLHTLTGEVVSAKMDKTIAVLIERKVSHPLYGKFIKRSTKILAHDEHNVAKEGDVVLVEATRPMSSRKVWRLQEVLFQAV